MIYKPDWIKVYRMANEILVVSETIESFPFSTTKLIKKFSDLSICSFKNARERGVEPTHFGSDSAFIVKMNGRHIILFNDKHPKSRIQFSLLHEFGHFLLGHQFRNINDELYGVQEVETNFFAAQLLMPKQLIQELFSRGVKIDEKFLVNYFGVSKEAARKRLEYLDKVKDFNFSREEVEYDDIILLKYGSFVEQIKRKPLFSFESDYEMELERENWY